jgi:hypothetical protein
MTTGVPNRRFVVFLLPFYSFRHSLSYLNGYHLHPGGNLGVPRPNDPGLCSAARRFEPGSGRKFVPLPDSW